MTSAVYDQALYHFGIGEVNFTTASRLWCVLTSNTGPTKTHSHYSDVKYGTGPELVTGNGYTQGGKTDTPGTVTIASNVCWFDAPDISWTSATFSAYFAIVQWGTPAATDANPLMCYLDLGGIKSPSNGTLSFTWYETGIFSLTSSTAT